MADSNYAPNIDANAELSNSENNSVAMPSSSTFLTDTHGLIHKDGRAYALPNYLRLNIVSSEYEDNEDEKQEEVINSPEYKTKEHVEIVHLSEFHTKRNSRALPAYATTYQLEKFQKNAMIIFNHVNIYGYKPRVGTKEDEKALRETFSRFGFEIEPPQTDLTKAELFDALRKFSEKDFTDYGCVVVVVMTHGDEGGQLKDKHNDEYYDEQIIKHFKTQDKPTLFTKPVILIVQACRGPDHSRSAGVMQKMKVYKDHDEQFTPYHLPVESDMAIFHSTYPGKVSFRPSNGTWFIQTICKKINQLHSTHDLLSIFMEVQKEIAINKDHTEINKKTNKMDMNKQMAVVTTTLIRKLYLRRFNDDPAIDSPTTSTMVRSMEETMKLELQNDKCSCYLEHFGYIRKCLSHIVENNPKDEVAIVAKNFLKVSKFENEFNNEKTKQFLILMSNYLRTHSRNSEYHKYIHFYSNECDTDVELLELQSAKNVQQNFLYWSPKHLLASLGTCVGAYVVYNLIKSK